MRHGLQWRWHWPWQETDGTEDPPLDSSGPRHETPDEDDKSTSPECKDAEWKDVYDNLEMYRDDYTEKFYQDDYFGGMWGKLTDEQKAIIQCRWDQLLIQVLPLAQQCHMIMKLGWIEAEKDRDEYFKILKRVVSERNVYPIEGHARGENSPCCVAMGPPPRI